MDCLTNSCNSSRGRYSHGSLTIIQSIVIILTLLPVQQTVFIRLEINQVGKSDTSGNETSTAILLSLNYEAKNADVSRDGWVVETSVHIAAIQV